jgi:putative membrane protein
VNGAVADAGADSPPRGAAVPVTLLAIYLGVFAWLGIAPSFREDWLLEHLVPGALLAILVATARRFRFSDFAYAFIFIALLLHEVGAHYTYSLVPYDRWFEAFSGRTLSEVFGWSRNHYDRFMHFLYGFLMMPAALELCAAHAPGRGIWRWLPALAFMWAHPAIYEIVEWVAAALFGGDLGVAWLGTQGDGWDAQKDMALALAGSACGLVFAARGRRTRRVG